MSGFGLFPLAYFWILAPEPWLLVLLPFWGGVGGYAPHPR
jgi:hypothetical protein